MRGTTNVPGACVILKDGNKVLFVLRGKTDWKPNEYVVPSGHVEAGETFRQAARREAEEEVGIKIRPDDLLYRCTVHRKSSDSVRIDVWFEAHTWSGEARNMEPHIHQKIEWLDVNKLPANTVDYMRFGLETIASGKEYGEFGWA